MKTTKRKRKTKKPPRFKTEDEERAFWADHDITEYFPLDAPIAPDLSNLKPSTKMVTVRVPEHLLRALKILANKKDVPYQSLLKVFLAEKVREEFSNLEKHGVT